MRVPHFLLLSLGLYTLMALFGCSRESSVKENVNLKNNHSRVFVFNTPIEDPQAFADSIANTVPIESDTIPDTLIVTVNDTVYLIGLLPYHVDKIYGFQWTFTKADGKDTIITGDHAKPESWAYANPGLYEPKFVAFDGNNATDTAGTATRKAWVLVIDTKPKLWVPKDTLWTRHDGDITFPILASDSFGTIKSVMIDLDGSGKDAPKVTKYETFEDNDSLYLTVKNDPSKMDSLGNQTVYVIVTDDDDNETLDSVHLHFNRVPRLKVIYPYDGARHNINDRFYFYYEGEDDDNPQNLQYFIYAQVSRNGQPPQKAFTEGDLIASEFTSNIFEPRDKSGNNVITLINDPNKQLTGRIYWDMYVTDGYDITRLARISSDNNKSRPWNFYIGDLSSSQGTFTGVAKYQGRDTHAGIHVEFNNGNKTFDTYTDEKGNYSVKVDVGEYMASASPVLQYEFKSAKIKNKLFIESGNTIKVDEMFLKDTVPPTIIVKNIDTLRSREYTQTIYARDLGAYLASVSASIDGKSKKISCSKSDNDAVFNCELGLSNLTDGDHNFTYTAKDVAGNVETLRQKITVSATKISLNVNGAQNERIGNDGKLTFSAQISGAYPAADSIEWSWNTEKGNKSKVAAIDQEGFASFTLNYADIAGDLLTDKDYFMKASYVRNGANVSTQVKFGLFGDKPAVYFTEPSFEETVSMNDSVYFKVSANRGVNSSDITVSWECPDIAEGYSCPGNNAMEGSLAFKSVGIHKVVVKVKDDKNETAEDSIFVNVISDAPSITVSTDSKTNEYKINSIVDVKVDASDKFGNINKIVWGCSNGKISFDQEYPIDPPTKEVSNLVLKNQLPGSETTNYRCVFKAIDDDGEEGADTLTFSTLLDLPTVRLATKKDTVKINSNQLLKAIASDKLGYITQYEYACSDRLAELKNPDWNLMDNAETYARMPSTAAKAYYCVVRVTDDDGNTAKDTAEYKVIVGLPTVTATVNHSRVTIRDVVELNAAAQDSLGSLVKYEWGCGAASAENIGFTYSSPTTPRTFMTMPATPQNGYLCIVRVTDDDGNTAKDTVSIDIILAPPTIEVANDSITVREGYNIALNATARDNNNLPSDPGEIAKKEWSCGTSEQIADNWKSVSSFDTVWKAPAAQGKFYCVARATDNDGNIATDTVYISFSTEVPLIWVKEDLIYINVGDYFDLDASVNTVWQGIDWFTWECIDKKTGKSLESKVTKFDYARNGKSFGIRKDSTYSEKEKDMYCIVSAQETSTKVTFSDTTEVRLMQHHPKGVISAADTVYLWSGDESVDDEALYFYSPEWNGKKSEMGDLGVKNMQDYWWNFSNVDKNFYQGNSDGSLDTSIAEFNTAFIRKTQEGSITISLDYRDSTSTAPTRSFYSRHRAEEVHRTVYFRKAWENLGKDTVIAASTMNTAPSISLANGKPVIAFLESEKQVKAMRLDGNAWKSIGSASTTDSVTQISTTVHGGNLYIAALSRDGKLLVFKSAGTTSPLAKVGTDTLKNVIAAKIISKESDSYPHIALISGENKVIYLYDFDGSTWSRNTKFNKFEQNPGFGEIDALYNDNDELVVLGVTTGHIAYYSYNKPTYETIRQNGFSALNVSQAHIFTEGENIYLGYLSRDYNNYGPRMGQGRFTSTEIFWIKAGEGNSRVFETFPIKDGMIAYHIHFAIHNGIIYAALDDNGRSTLSQVHVYRYENNKWHLHGENQLPYFNTVFYKRNNYYLRGSNPMLAIDGSGKIYLSMIARENAGGNNRNNGPLVMKYVADNWEIK